MASPNSGNTKPSHSLSKFGSFTLKYSFSHESVDWIDALGAAPVHCADAPPR